MSAEEFANQDVLYSDNIADVQDMDGENVPNDKWYHVRVSKVKTHDDKGQQLLSDSSGEPKCQVWLNVQDEPFVGRNIFQQPSLQPHALAWLKAAYKAAGFNIDDLRRGHNPHKLLNCEFFVKPTENLYQGQKRQNVAPWNIKPLAEGRPIK